MQNSSEISSLDKAFKCPVLSLFEWKQFNFIIFNGVGCLKKLL